MQGPLKPTLNSTVIDHDGIYLTSVNTLLILRQHFLLDWRFSHMQLVNGTGIVMVIIYRGENLTNLRHFIRRCIFKDAFPLQEFLPIPSKVLPIGPSRNDITFFGSNYLIILNSLVISKCWVFAVTKQLLRIIFILVIFNNDRHTYISIIGHIQ
jgi:hypothetical protein